MDCVLGLPTATRGSHPPTRGQGISRFSRKMLPCMLGGFDHAGSATPRHRGMVGIAFCRNYGMGTRDVCVFAAQYPAYTYPCQRFRRTLAGVPT